MIDFNFKLHGSILLITLFIQVFLIPIDSNAQRKLSSVSGRVLTSKGEPIQDLRVGIGELISETDVEGRFAFDNVRSTKTEFSIYDSGEIRVIKFGVLSLYYHGFGRDDGVVFSIKPGTDVNNLKVFTHYQNKIQGKILFKNGEPLANTFIDVNFDLLTMDTANTFHFKPSLQTDEKGYFVHSVNSFGVYIMSLNHRGLSVESTPFILRDGEQHKPLILALNGNSIDLSEPLAEESKVENKNRPRNLPHIPGMWLINPDNGHEYKWIECKDRIDAQVLAAKENAHLVTITSKEEQVWLESVFGDGPYWIGLTYVFKEGEWQKGVWQWDTGELITYTNWSEEDVDRLQLSNSTPAFLQQFGKKNVRHEYEPGQDYAIMSSGRWGSDIGKWRTAHETGARRGVGRTSMAILEKEVE